MNNNFKWFIALVVALGLVFGIGMLAKDAKDPTVLEFADFAVAKAQVKFDYCSWICELDRYQIGGDNGKDCLNECISSNDWEEINNFGSWLYRQKERMNYSVSR